MLDILLHHHLIVSVFVIATHLQTSSTFLFPDDHFPKQSILFYI